MFSLFVSGFLILAPLIVLFTAGYRFNPQTRTFVRTGAMSVSASPRVTSIFLSGEFSGKSTPHVFKRVIPGTYTVELKRNGFFPWTGHVTVQSGATGFVAGSMLLRDDSAFLKDPLDLNNGWISPSGRSAVIMDGRTAYRWNIESGFDSIGTGVGQVLSHQVEWAVWSPNETYVALVGDETVSVIGTSSKTITSQELLGERVFFGTSDDKLYVESAKGVTEISLSTLARTERSVINNSERSITESIQGTNDILQFTRLENDVALRRISGNNSTLIALLPVGDYSLLATDATRILLNKDGQSIVLVDTASSSPVKLNHPATIYDWDNERGILLLSDGFELTSYNMTSEELSVITRTSTPIVDIALEQTGTYAIASSNQEIIAYELTPVATERYSVRLTDSFTTIYDITLAEKENSLLILGEAGVQEGVFLKRLR